MAVKPRKAALAMLNKMANQKTDDPTPTAKGTKKQGTAGTTKKAAKGK